MHPLFRHAIRAPEVAPIGDRDPQILDAPSEGVDEGNRRGVRVHPVRLGVRRCGGPGVGFALAPRRRSDQLQPTALCLSGCATSRQPVAPFHRCHVGCSLPIAVRPPRRPRDVYVLPLSVGFAKRLREPVTFATPPNKGLSRRHRAPNTPDSGSLQERVGQSSTASSVSQRQAPWSPPAPGRCGAPSGTTRTPVGRHDGSSGGDPFAVA